MTEGYPDCLSVENGFVRETASFIICDDLRVIPFAFATTVHLLQKLGVSNSTAAVVELIVDINKKKVIDLLKLSLLSKTPLTELLLKKNKVCDYSNIKNQTDFVIRNQTFFHRKKISVKVTVRKSTEVILFAEGQEDFVDFILSFLTIPLGGVLHMLELEPSSSSLCCFDNLYKSLIELYPERFLWSSVLKEKLVKPKCFPNFNLTDPILPIGVANLFSPGVQLLDPKVSTLKSSNFGEFVKGPSVYMVTGDLVVTPMTSTSALSYLRKSKVPVTDLEHRVIQISTKEGLSLLKALLISTSCLTNALKPYVSKVKEEK